MHHQSLIWNRVSSKRGIDTPYGCAMLDEKHRRAWMELLSAYGLERDKNQQ